MKATWKKVYHGDGNHEVWPDGRKPPEFELINLPPPDPSLTRLLAELDALILTDWGRILGTQRHEKS